MDNSPYAHLLEKTRLPQPPFQRYAVTSIFEKLRSAPPHLCLDSDPGRDAVSHCLGSTSAAVVDQAVRELCRLVRVGGASVDLALLELQAALEGCGPRFVGVFVKGIGFLSQFAFRNDPAWWRRRHFESPELHPFVKVLSCRNNVQEELVQQVLLFIVRNMSVGFRAVSEFIRPFLIYSVLRIPFSVSSSQFSKDLISSVASLSCSFPTEAVSIIRLLIGCLEYFPCRNEEEFKCLISSSEYLVDALVVILKQIVGTGMPTSEAQFCCVELLETLLSICTNLFKPCGGNDPVVELSHRLLLAQKDFGLPFLPEFSSASLLLSVILTQIEFEHEKLSVLKLLIFLMEWRVTEYKSGGAAFNFTHEFLSVFPVINLLSSSSKSVKNSATYFLSLLQRHILNFLIAPEKAKNSADVLLSRSKPVSVLCRLLNHVWFEEQSSLSRSYFLEFAINDNSEKERCNKPTKWISLLREFALSNGERSKFMPVSQCEENILAGMPLLLSAVVSILIVHPTLGFSAVDSLAAISLMDPKVNMALLLSILFYHKLFCCNESNSPELLLKLLEMLPSLASCSAMVPLIVQTILPMLQKNVQPVLYATAVRLLCKTWMVTDRAFGSLQGILDPRAFSEYISQRVICISIAASVRDVCRHNPDRGVDLILSVSSCIESKDSYVKALGLESLAHLCEADVVDFYTAWNVIEMHLLDYSVDPVVARGLCILLRWGAMDAEAYSEASKSAIQILWEVGTSKNNHSGLRWVKAQASAFESLTHFEVEHVQKTIPDLQKKSLEILFSENDAEVLKAMEGFHVKIINFEHINRRRLLKEKRVMVHKVGKLLDVFPQVMFPSGIQKVNASELPGAALLSLAFGPKNLQNQGTSKDLPKLHAAYETALLEISESLQLSRNILVALLALESWKAFMNRWLRAVTIFIDAKVSSIVSDESSKPANAILKTLHKFAEESIPRVAENIALAIGALCMVLPASARAIASNASRFLLKWLFQYEHEHRQWSAAISLGMISNCLHATDRAQKFDIIRGLLEVLWNTKSCLVKGACGVGLGFSCQYLLTRVEIDNDSIFEGTITLTESTLLGKIVRSLSLMISQLCPSSSESLERLCEKFLLGGDDPHANETSNMSCDKSDDLDYTWGVAGLVLGLGNTVVAIYRSEAYDAVFQIKDMLMSWIPHIGSSVQCSQVPSEMPEMPLSVGSCLALPTVVAFCLRVEMADIDLDGLLSGYRSLISELLTVKDSGALHQNLLMASCFGAGSLLSCILNAGVHSVKVDDIKSLLEVIRNIYNCPYPPTVYLGGMLGVVNAFGADSGTLTHMYPQPSSLKIDHEQKDQSYIRGPLLSSSAFELLSTSMIQEMFVVAKESKDLQLRRYATWAISFLRYRWSSKEFHNVNGLQSGSIDSKQDSRSFSEDSLVWRLYSWLNSLELDSSTHLSTVATVLRCLSKAPRLLGSSDWGAIIRRCMKYGVQGFGKPQMRDLAPEILREECMHFSLAHAKHADPLLHFLDELADLSRFRRLEPTLQSSLLCHLSDLEEVFSTSRLEKLYTDLIEYFSSPTSPYLVCNADQKCLLRTSFWKGLHRSLVKASTKLDCISEIEKCMELLFSLLPLFFSNDTSKGGQAWSEEFLDAVHCLTNARQSWLMDMLQVPEMDLVHGGSHHTEITKKIFVRAKMVMLGCLPVSGLGKLKAYILNSKFEGTWSVLIEVAAAIYRAEGSIKRHWLLDAVEISCITQYPSTTLQFIGMLSSGCCKYMPLLMLNPDAVLSDLPITLPSLLSDSGWTVIAEPLVAMFWVSTERICNWAKQVGEGVEFPGPDRIDGSEKDKSVFLARVMHRTCVSLRDYMPLEKQLRLANLSVP